SKVGVVDEGHSTLRSNGVDTRLKDLRYRGARLRWDYLGNSDSVHMNSFFIGDFFCPNEKKIVVGICIEKGRIGVRIVIGNGQKLVTVALVPRHHVIRRRVAIGIDRVGVKVSLIPIRYGWDLCHGSLHRETKE